MLLGSLGRILAAVLTCTTLPSSGVHLRSLLVGWIGLLVLLKIWMPPWLIRLILSIVVGLGGLLRCCGVTLPRGRWRLLPGCTANRRLTGSTRWTGRGCLRWS